MAQPTNAQKVATLQRLISAAHVAAEALIRSLSYLRGLNAGRRAKLATTTDPLERAKLEALISQTHHNGDLLIAKINILRSLNVRRRARIASLQPKPLPPTGAKRRFGIDYTSLSPSEARAVGASFVCRYLATQGNPKDITAQEVRDLRRAGLDIVLVWETTATRARDGFNAGVSDATAAHNMQQAVGIPTSRPIYFAVDEDMSADPGAIDGYFDGVKSVLGLARTGAYGGYDTIKHLFDTRRISFGWQAFAWSQGRWDQRAQLEQYENLAAYDKDRTLAVDFGQSR